MKSTLLTILLFTIIVSANAQEPCATVKAEQDLLKKFPSLNQKRNESEIKSFDYLQRTSNAKLQLPNTSSGASKNGYPTIQSLCGNNNTYFTTIAAPSTLNQTVSPNPNCTYGGEYVTVTNMIAGRIYEIQTCGNANFDTQITIYDQSSNAVAHNDDYCGAQSVLYFNPIVSGTYDILIDEYNCNSNTICASLEVKLVYTPRPVLTIPVVVHVVYKNGTENISTAQIQSQINALNDDFRRQNADIINTPPAFRGFSDDPLIEFCLAQQDPSGNPTTGITRTFTTVSSFSSSNAIKFTSLGGEDNWDPYSYLNIWTGELSGGLLGYAQFPYSLSTLPFTDGVVVDYRAFGTIGTATSPNDLGRVSTHEVGHWLNLRHIWGDDGGTCTGSDSVPDTPNQEEEIYGCIIFFPETDNCSTVYPGIMYMNYMDYTDDDCKFLFTVGQAGRMDGAIFNERVDLWTSVGCQPSTIGINENNFLLEFSILPNPSDGVFIIEFQNAIPNTVEIKILNLIGEEVGNLIKSGNTLKADLSNESNGIYFIRIGTGANLITRKLVVAR